MIIYWLFFLLLSYSAFKDWKKTVIMWLPLQLLFNECVCLKYNPPAISFTLAADTVLILAYFRYKKEKYLNNESFLFKEVFIAFLISYFLSTLFSIVPLDEVITNTVKYFIENFIILYLFQKALKTAKDIRLFFKCSSIVILLFISLGLLEVALRDNLILDYVYINAPKEFINGKMFYVPPYLNSSGDLSQRFGLIRAYSFFNIHIAFGTTCVLLLFLFLHMLKHKTYFLEKKYLIFFISLLIIGIFLSNSKTPMIGLFFFILAFIDFKKKSSIQILVSIGLVVGITFIFFPSYLNNFFAIFDSKLSERGGGSNITMRKRQFDIALELFSMNPLFGNGIRSIGAFIKNYSYADLLGSESSWLKILPERGIIGVVTYIYLYWIMFHKLRKRIPTKELLFFLIGLMAMETATGFMSMPLYGSILIVIYRVTSIKNRLKYHKQIT